MRIILTSNSSLLPRIKSILLTLLFIGAAVFSVAPVLPVTGGVIVQDAPDTQTELPRLVDFSRQVHNGDPGQVVGLYVPSIIASPVVAQPADQPSYVSTREDVVTKFGMADSYGSLGFLAHNTLAGSLFDELEMGNLVHVIYGDGDIALYAVRSILRFQAIEPLNPYSNFIDEQSGALLTGSDLFFQTYGVPGQLTLQTCISAGGSDSWGRLFVIASPVDQVVLPRASSKNKSSWLRLE
jgi:hypothetical protein